MLRLGLALIALCLFVPHAWAIQLGDRREQIVAQYGVPASGELPIDRGMGTYRWNGWRLDIEMIQGMAQRLIFTKEAIPLSEAEERQLLNQNGGVNAWQPTDHVLVDVLAGKKWHRATDGAEAFTLAGDPHVMCLATRTWGFAWTKAHRPSVQPPSVSVVNPPTPAANPFVGLILLAGLVGFIGFLGRLVMQSWKRERLPASPAYGGLWVPPTTKHLKSACTVAPPPPLPSAPASRLPTRKTLDDLSWQEFELMIGELYRRQGYTVELCSGDGSDGGVDLWLRRDGKTVLVQCKHWKVYKVGVSPVRELFGILAAEKADYAIFVTTGRFTQDARAFAAGKAMELIDGETLAATLEAHKYSGDGELLDVASWSDTFAQTATITTPVCPFCRSSMVLRRGKQSGNQFWGCSTYPGCRGKRNVRPELMRDISGAGA